MQISLAVVGIGKIARTQHLPAIQNNPKFQLTAVADPFQALDSTPSYRDLDALLTAHPDVEAVALCTPTQMRHRIARAALRAGKHVLLEKPPCATLNELDDLKAIARERRLTLFTAWHSRHAPAVSAARAWLHNRRPIAVSVLWQEDVRVWHPGQNWIWQPGGLGVFDAGINALSILTHIMPCHFAMRSADLRFPANRQAPITADIFFETEQGAPMRARFDWSQPGAEIWTITIRTEDGAELHLSQGGGHMTVDGQVAFDEHLAEYDSIYAKFAELIFEGAADVDGRPLKHVADAFMLANRVPTDPFLDL